MKHTDLLVIQIRITISDWQNKSINIIFVRRTSGTDHQSRFRLVQYKVCGSGTGVVDSSSTFRPPPPPQLIREMFRLLDVMIQNH